MLVVLELEEPPAANLIIRLPSPAPSCGRGRGRPVELRLLRTLLNLGDPDVDAAAAAAATDDAPPPDRGGAGGANKPTRIVPVAR